MNVGGDIGLYSHLRERGWAWSLYFFVDRYVSLITVIILIMSLWTLSMFNLFWTLQSQIVRPTLCLSATPLFFEVATESIQVFRKQRHAFGKIIKNVTDLCLFTKNTPHNIKLIYYYTTLKKKNICNTFKLLADQLCLYCHCGYLSVTFRNIKLEHNQFQWMTANRK